jgi:hypothetical protein
LFFCLAWVPFATAASSDATVVPPWGEAEVILNTSVEWQTPSMGLLADNPYTPLWRFNGSTYFVWTDSTNRPWVTKINNLVPETAPLDTGADYVAQPDAHHLYSMGIDKNGYIHIAGDMHYYDEDTVAVINPYPLRYQKQTILYWKSKLPMSVTGGFAFTGTKGSTTALPGNGWTYGRFFTDSSGVLYYSSRVRAILAGSLPGEMGIGLYRYDTVNQTWTAIGKEADQIRAGTYFKVLAWEAGGMAPDQTYQGFRTHLKFDLSNRLQLAFSINTDTTLEGNDRLIYAMSPDGGVTWKKANGDIIPDLPIRAVDTSANRGDLVAHLRVAPFIGSDVDVVSDLNGRPAVIVDSLWRLWTGTQWLLSTAFNSTSVTTPDFGSVAPGNSLVASNLGIAKLAHAKTFAQKAYGYDLPAYKDFVAFDEYGLRTTGVAYGVGVDLAGKTESILKTTITAAPLPCTWQGLDISLTGGTAYAGMAGYLYKTFVVTNYGAALGGKTDSFRYVYGKMTGDGTIVSQVDSTAPAANARAGVMIRQTLGSESPFAMMSIGRRLGAIFSYRNVTGNGTYSTINAAIPNPYWIKLTRTGNVFTGSMSKDGVTWTDLAKTTIVLPTTLYVGLASAGYHTHIMQRAIYTHVSAPGCVPN